MNSLISMFDLDATPIGRSASIFCKSFVSTSPSFKVDDDKEGEDLLELTTIVSSDFSPKNGEDLLELPLLPLLVLSSDPNSISSIVKSGEGCKGLGFIIEKYSGFLVLRC